MEYKYAGIDFTETLHHDTYPAISPSKADLSSKVVVITGASRGIGRATALSYAKAGASGIAILARSDLSSLADELVAAARDAGRQQPKVLNLNGVDAVDRAAVEQAAMEVEKVFGNVDVLINNAGHLDPPKPLDESDPDEWWRTWEVNVKGVYLMDKYFIPLVLKSDLKTVVVLSSIGAHIAVHGMSAYQATKLAVLRLNDFLNAEYGQQGLIAYGIHPGGVMTDLALNMDEVYHSHLVDTPELAGDCLVWLTKERREWLAERYISVTWDVDELLAKKDDIVKDDLLKVRMRL